MKTYSQDLREKVMAVVAAGQQSNRRIAETFGISESTIEKWTRRRRETGSLAPAAHAGGLPRVLAPHQTFLRAAVKAQRDITLDELCTQVAQELKLSVSPSMVSRELSQIDLGRKKSRSTTANGRRRG
jgi:putative transposase